jgi:hypothetical protein
MIEFLKALDPSEPRRRPAGVGQKTVNLATERGFIVSSLSRPSARLPDLHQVTLVGVEALDQLLIEPVKLAKGRPRKRAVDQAQ